MTKLSLKAVKKKPEVIQYYNGTKARVDSFDQLICTYSCKRQTKRWPVVMQYNLLDVAALNAFVVFSTQNSEFGVAKTRKRRLFLRSLAEKSVIPQMRRRLRVTTNLRSTVLGVIKRCGVSREKNAGTVLGGYGTFWRSRLGAALSNNKAQTPNWKAPKRLHPTVSWRPKGSAQTAEPNSPIPVLKIPVTKRKCCHYSLRKKIVKVPWYAGIQQKRV